MKYENYKKLLIACKKSGKSAKKWCKEKGISYDTYCSWRKRVYAKEGAEKINKQHNVANGEYKKPKKYEEYRKKVIECRSSGMNMEEWCKKEGIKYTSYRTWQRRVFEKEDKIAIDLECLRPARKKKEAIKIQRNPEVYESESITILIYESGVKSFDWYNPKEFVEEVKGDGELLPFEDIEEIFKNQVFISNPPINSAVNKNIIGIENLDFSMMTVPKQGANDEYYLIPVWNFSGYNEMSIMYTQENLGLTDEQAAEDPFLNTEFNSVNYGCYLTINAIDGTVIDMNSWY